MDEWVVWFYMESFTLHMNRDRGRHLLSPIFLVPFPVPVLVTVPDTVSVITPWFFKHRTQFRTHLSLLGKARTLFLQRLTAEL